MVRKQRERLILNLVNYDYDVRHDSIRPAEDIRISIPYERLGLPEPISVRLLSPDLELPRDLVVSRESGEISFSVPQLEVWDVIVVSHSGS